MTAKRPAGKPTQTPHTQPQALAVSPEAIDFATRVAHTLDSLQRGHTIALQASRVKVAQMARSRGPQALAVIIELMDDPDPMVRHKAATTVLERGYGKPRETEGEINLDQASREMRIAALEGALREEREALASERRPVVEVVDNG